MTEEIKINENDPQGEITDRSGVRRLFSNKYLLKLLWPLFVEQFLLFAVGLLDSVMVASVGEAAVSAVSLVDSLMVLIITVFTAIATGGAVVVGQYLGQKRGENANKAADQLFISAFMLSLVVILVMYILRNWVISFVFGNMVQIKEQAFQFLPGFDILRARCQQSWDATVRQIDQQLPGPRLGVDRLS